MTIINNISTFGSKNNMANATQKIDFQNTTNQLNTSNNISNSLQSSAKINTTCDNSCSQNDIIIGGYKLPKSSELPYDCTIC
ncbi:hypothetical protein DDB_G0272188 [Dictyostelium discoideum AX4]|uniref:Uncharacterized protein DDB_G0272188 n=1 Tax=Dictyostelium discoideum TaxID=44689 RepID=Y8734_DICDI|nr:hypothetical protein DDB_G0272188 [Dictyostelium discoideum AX4]Q75JW9.1 RecName: Full=Uncharacterized protein DDB_G0272188 [Dictyostelium discoideum]EAL71246.1 hypothetical protein DDB_G0272188 [Dictyostelium discoideum AX4]|eukprot:XP_645220.1 hypothetical protein DDB_G0272188 [Dictyostelium discoideum AX4]